MELSNSERMASLVVVQLYGRQFHLNAELLGLNTAERAGQRHWSLHSNAAVSGLCLKLYTLYFLYNEYLTQEKAQILSMHCDACSVIKFATAVMTKTNEVYRIT